MVAGSRLSRTIRSTRWALIASLAAPVWFFGWLLMIAALRPGYSHATNAISELGAWGAPHMALWNTVGFAGTGLALLASPGPTGAFWRLKPWDRSPWRCRRFCFA